MVAQEDAPLAGVGDRRRALHDLDDRLAILEPQRHEHPRHQREVERHVELVAVAEVGAHVLRPHVGLGEQHLPGKFSSSRRRSPARLVGLGQVLAGGALALDEVGHGVHAEPVHAQVEPELHDLPDLLAHRRVVVVQVRLVAEEAVPVVGLRDGVPGPVRHLGVEEDDPHVRGSVSSVSLQTYQSRVGLSGERRASWNQGCWSEVWLSDQLGDDPRPRVVGRRRGTPGSRRGCRSSGGSRSSPRCRSRRRGTATGTSAAARGSRRRAPSGSRAGSGQAAEVAHAVAVRCRRRP